MKNGVKIGIVSLLVVGILMWAGRYACTSKEVRVEQTEREQDKRLTIGATLASEESKYLQSISYYMKEAALEKDVELILKYAEWDIQQQIEQIDEFIRQQVDAIILCPANPKSLLMVLKRVKEAGIPIINLNMQLDATSTQYVTTYVGASSSEEAELAAQLYIEALGEEGGEIAIIEGAKGSDTQIFRTQAFIEALNAYPQIEIVDIGCGNWNRETAKLVAKEIISRNSNLRGIFCHDSDMAMGVIAAIEELKVEGEIYVVGIGEDEEYLQALYESKLYGIVTQPPDYEGKSSIYCAIMAIEGKNLRPWYKDPIQLLKREDLASYIWKQNE